MKRVIFIIICTFLSKVFYSSIYAQNCSTYSSTWDVNLKKSSAAFTEYFYKNKGNFQSSPALGQRNLVKRRVPIAFHKIAEKIGTTHPNDILTSGVAQELVDSLNVHFGQISIEFFVEAMDTIYIRQYYNNWTVNITESTDIYSDGSLTFPNYMFSQFNHGSGINIYITKTFNNGRNGWAKFPDAPMELKGIIGLIYMKDAVTTKDILIHEMGHALGLLHTFGMSNSCDGTSLELVDGSNCETSGDYICDTPASPGVCDNVDANCNYSGNQKDAAGNVYHPDLSNFMEYSGYNCTSRFSPMQLARMRWTLDSIFHYFGREEKGIDGYCTPSIEVADHIKMESIRIDDQKYKPLHHESGYYFDPNFTFTLFKEKANKMTLQSKSACITKAADWQVFIDLNGDGDFYDQGESIFNNSYDAGTLIYLRSPDFDFWIPNIAKTGKTRMRILLRSREAHIYPNLPPSACAYIYKGEVIDVSVDIKPEVSNEFSYLSKQDVNTDISSCIDFLMVGNYKNFSRYAQNGYIRYENDSLQIQRGKNYPGFYNYSQRYILTQFGNGYFVTSPSAWLDLNHDGEFTQPEMITVSSKNYFNVHVPDNYPYDKVCMRVRVGGTNVGEVQDYIFKVIDNKDNKPNEVIFPETNIVSLDNEQAYFIQEIRIGSDNLNDNYDQYIRVKPFFESNHIDTLPITLFTHIPYFLNILHLEGADQFGWIIDTNDNGYFDAEDENRILKSDEVGYKLIKIWLMKFNGIFQTYTFKVYFDGPSNECGASYPLNYTSPKFSPIPPSVSSGVEYDFRFAPTFYTNANFKSKYTFWLDMNLDGDYLDPGEKLFESPSVLYSDSIKFKVNFPSSAASPFQKILIQKISDTLSQVIVPLSCERLGVELIQSFIYPIAIDYPFIRLEGKVSDSYEFPPDAFGPEGIIVCTKTDAPTLKLEDQVDWLNFELQSTGTYNGVFNNELSMFNFYHRGDAGTSLITENSGNNRQADISVTGKTFKEYQFKLVQEGTSQTTGISNSSFDFNGIGGIDSFYIYNVKKDKVTIVNENENFDFYLKQENENTKILVTAKPSKEFLNYTYLVGMNINNRLTLLNISLKANPNYTFDWDLGYDPNKYEYRINLPPSGKDTLIRTFGNWPFKFGQTTFYPSAQKNWILPVLGNDLLIAQDSCEKIMYFRYSDNLSNQEREANFMLLFYKNGNYSNYHSIRFVQKPFEYTTETTSTPSNDDFFLYPNPSSDIIYIDNNEAGTVQYKIIDIVGKLCKVGKLSKTINILDLEPGVYIIQFSRDGQPWKSKKIVIAR